MTIIRDRRGRPILWDEFVARFVTDYAIVAETVLRTGCERVRVITGWLGLTQCEDDGEEWRGEGPLFVTRVHGGACNRHEVGYHGLLQAVRGHDRVVHALRAGLPLPHGDEDTRGRGE